MAVGQNNPPDTIHRNAEIPVFPVRLGPAALKSAAVNKDAFAIGLNDVFRPGNLFSRPKGIKGNIHAVPAAFIL
jgi:hypothetical protein